MRRLITTILMTLVWTSVARSDDWPQWRGPQRTGISKETGLLQVWPATGPALRWKATEIGTGYSSPSIVHGRVYLQTTHNNDEFTLTLDEKTGAKIWEVPIGKVGKNRGPQYPGTRSTPTVDGDRIYCLASDGELTCLDSAKGDTKWKKHLRQDLGGADGNWAYSESVLIDGDVLVCTPGGSDSALAALNKNTGETIWKSTVPDGGTAEYASIMIVDQGPVKQYVTFLRKGLVGVDAKTGKFLWMYNKTIDQGANILTPIVVGERVFSAGSRTGGGLVQLKADGGGVTADPIYFARTVAPSIGGAVLVDGNLYGTSGDTMFCADFDTGKVKWTDRAVGPASLCYADRRLYVRGHGSGDVVLVEPSPEGYREKGRFTQPDRSKTQAWPHPVVANGGFYLRDQGVLLCYDVAAQ
jgi:outer membrane protein assembly factor BamB